MHAYCLPDDDLYNLVELVSLELEGVENPGEGSLAVVGKYHDLKAGSEQNLGARCTDQDRNILFTWERFFQ